MSTLNGARVAITGGNGFIGSHLCNTILKDYPNAKVHILDINTDIPNPILVLSSNIYFHELDIRVLDKISDIIESIEPTHVIHLAAFVNVGRDFGNIDDAIHVNIIGTTNLLRILSKLHIESFIHIGTSEIYGDNDPPFNENMPIRPTSPYSIAKAASELLCNVFSKSNDIPTTYLRLFNVFGEGQSESMMIPQVIISCLRQEAMDLTQGVQTREVNYVSDIVNGIIRASVTDTAVGEIINLGSGKEISVKELALKIREMAGSSINLNFGALPYREHEIWRMFNDCEKAERFLGWKCQIDLEDGLRKTIAWYKEKMK